MKAKTKKRPVPPPPPTPLEEVRRWWHKPHWQLLLGIAFVLVVVVTVQCFYPYEKSLPSARVGGVLVENKSREQIIQQLHDTFSSVPLTVTIPGAKPIQTSSVEVGIVPDYQAAASSITEYSLAKRLVPFSFVNELFSSHVQLPYDIESELFNAFAKKVHAVCATEPKDASIAFEKGRATLVPSQSGQRCTTESVRGAVSALVLQADENQLPITPETITPNRTDEAMRPQLIAAQTVIDKGLSLATPLESWTVSAEEIASWLTVSEKGELQTKADSIKAYLKKQRGKLYVDPGTTTIRIVDGVEVERVEGNNGQGIDLEVTEKRVTTALLGETADKTAWAQLTVLPPKQSIQRQYTPSHIGLQALIEQWDREHAGRYGIIVRDLSGAGWNAQLLADYDFVTASTYKMFLAYAVLHKVEEGQLSMNTKTNIGLSVRDCIDEMILHSTNACATALFDLAGWNYVHHFILGQFPSTRLDNSTNPDNEKHTTVRDEVTFMHRLWAGQLMNNSNTTYLTDLFKRQIYRGGIPAGVPGVTVADKVGFYAGYKHDVGIVYAPSGTYILGIMSYGGADWEFADLSRKVHDLMKQR